MRFFQPTPTQYIPQYTPLNLELMKQTLDAREMQDLKAEDALAEAANSLVVKGGMYTKPEEIEEVNNYLQSNINNVAQKLHAGDIDAKDAVLNINRLKTFYNTHPSVQFFKEDENLTNLTRTAMTQGKLNNAVSPGATYFDNQLKINRPISWKEGKESLANAYNFKTPTSIDAEQNYGKRYADIKPSSLIQEYVNQNGFTFQRDSATGLPLVIDKKTGTVNEQVTWQMLYDAGLTMAPDELKNSATDYVQYQKARYKNYTEQQFAREFANAGAAKIFTKRGITSENKYDVLESLYNAEQAAAANQDFVAPTANIAPADQSWGVDPDDFKKRTAAGIYDIITGGPTDWFLTGDTKEGAKQFLLTDKEPYELDNTPKQYLENWAKNNPNWQHIYKNYMGPNNPNNIDMPEGTKKEMYKAFYKDMKEYTKDIVRTATTATAINYYTPDQIKEAAKYNLKEAAYLNRSTKVWQTYVGNKSTGTISDVLVNAVNNSSRIWSVTDKKFLKQEDIKIINNNYGTTNVPSLGQTNPENILNVLTSDDTFKNAVTFSTPDGNQYMIEDRTFNNNADIVVSNFYRKGKMALGQPVEMEFNNNTYKYKIDKDNQNILLDKNDKQIIAFGTTTDMLVELSNPKSEIAKKARYQTKSATTTGKK